MVVLSGRIVVEVTIDVGIVGVSVVATVAEVFDGTGAAAAE